VRDSGAAVVGTVTKESNDYFAIRYWALKKITIILLPIAEPSKKVPVMIISLFVTEPWKK
jgi:hypothetical protein